MRQGLVLFRSDGLFPADFLPDQEGSYPGWTIAPSDTAAKTASKTAAAIRSLGWYFAWLSASSVRIGVGWSEESAIHNAMCAGLAELNERFNTAEVLEVRVRRYPGFHVAHVQLASRHIQKWASLGLVDEAVFREFPEPLEVQI